MRIPLVLAALAAAAFHILAQSSQFYFDLYSTRDGLSSNDTRYMCDDENGYLWIATSDGLNRFDGKHFRKFFNNPDDSTSLPINSVLGICNDRKGRLWLGTAGKGICSYNLETGTFTRHRMLPLSGDESKTEFVLRTVVAGGEVFALTRSGLLFRLNRDKNLFEELSNDFISGGSVPSGAQFGLAPDSTNGGIWFVGKNQFYFLKLPEWEMFSREHNPHHLKIFDHVSNCTAAIDGEGRLWYQELSSMRLCNYHMPSDKVTYFTIPEDIYFHEVDLTVRVVSILGPDHLLLTRIGFSTIFNHRTSSWDTSVYNRLKPGSAAAEAIYQVFRDRAGKHWLVTSEGLYGERIFRHQTLLFNPQLDIDETVTSVVTFDSVVVITSDRQSLINYPDKDVFVPFTSLVPGERSTQYACVWNISEEWLLVTPNYKEYAFVHKRSFAKVPVAMPADVQEGTLQSMRLAASDRSGRIWFAKFPFGLMRRNTDGTYTDFAAGNEGNLPVAHVLCWTQHPDGRLLVGLGGGKGIWKHDSVTDSFTPLITRESNDVLNNYTIRTIKYAPDGRLFVGTSGGGLNVWNETTGEHSVLSRHQGLPGDIVNHLKIVGSHLLIGTNNGLVMLNLSSQLLSPVMDETYSYKMTDVELSNSNEKTDFFYYDQQLIYRCDLLQPVVSNLPDLPAIADFEVFDKQVFSATVPKRIELNYHQNFFTIDLTAFDFGRPPSVEVSYMLEGFDPDWKMAGPELKAAYTNVPGDDYVFKIRSRKMGGQWGDLNSYSIIIHPPFWETWWFRIAAFIAVSALVYGAYRYRLAQILKLQAVRDKIASDLHDDLGATLSSINIYSRLAIDKIDGNKAGSRELLERISQSTSETMENMSDIVWSINPLNDTLQSLIQRINVHAAEVLGPMNVMMETSNLVEQDYALSMTARKNIYLIAKEAMNNIAKHSGASAVQISYEVSGRNLLIGIADDGRGEKHEAFKSGNGLRTMKQRALELKGIVDITFLDAGGTQVHVKLPLDTIVA